MIRRRLLLGWMALPFPALAQEDTAVGWSAAIERVIRGQLEAFGRDDAVGAYQFAAPNIQRSFPTAAAFLDMVRRAYPPVYRSRSATFGPLATLGGVVTQDVDLVGKDGSQVTATYTLMKGPNGWLITGCSLRPGVRVST